MASDKQKAKVIVSDPWQKFYQQVRECFIARGFTDDDFSAITMLPRQQAIIDDLAFALTLHVEEARRHLAEMN